MAIPSQHGTFTGLFISDAAAFFLVFLFLIFKDDLDTMFFACYFALRSDKQVRDLQYCACACVKGEVQWEDVPVRQMEAIVVDVGQEQKCTGGVLSVICMYLPTI